VAELLALKLTTGRCAAALIGVLAGHWCRMPQMLGGRPLLIDIHAVADQIGALENAPLSRAAPTKPAAEFTAGPLKGLWHKHWFQAGFMIKNLIDENEKSGLGLIHRRLRKHYSGVKFDGKPIDETDVKLLAHAAVFDALDYRAGNARRGAKPRLTGEWIVFAKSQGRNIYLTLGSHDESNEAILQRCLPGVREFPDLECTQPFVGSLIGCGLHSVDRRGEGNTNET
jgi:hypothetical protein